jgi:predicted alternative tryptophan synthase beta-subunit
VVGTPTVATAVAKKLKTTQDHPTRLGIGQSQAVTHPHTVNERVLNIMICNVCMSVLMCYKAALLSYSLL